MVAALLASVTLLSCEREKEIVLSQESKNMTVTVQTEDVVGEQELLLAVTGGGSTVFAASGKADEAASFSFCLSPAPADAYLYQAVYPASAVVKREHAKPSALQVHLPSVQHATAEACDPSALIMVAKATWFDRREEHWKASLRSIVATNCLTLQGLPSGKSFSRVEIIAPAGVGLSGDCEMNMSTGASTFLSEEGRTIEVKFASALPGGSNLPVWFTCWNAELGTNDQFTIVAYSTDKYSYTKSVSIPAFAHLTPGSVNAASISMSGISGVKYYFSGGLGTELSPWRIETQADLTEMASKVSAGTGGFSTAFYRQTADINYNGSVLNAIGNTNTDSNAHCFKGSYDGGGCQVKNAVIRNGQSKKAVGFFGYLADGAHVNGLCLENPTVEGTGTWNVGAIAGCIQGASTVIVENCVVTGGQVSAVRTSQGGYHVGGLVGRQMSGLVQNCTFSGTVRSVDNNKVGGIVGNLSGGRILRCSVTGAQTSIQSPMDFAGGIVGYVDQNAGFIENCLVDCKEILGTRGRLGGIVGGWQDGSGTINRCTVTCDVINHSASGNYGCVGGIAGWIGAGENRVLVINCCYAGGVLANQNGTGGGVAGIVGQVTGQDPDRKAIVNCCAFPTQVSTGSTNANIAGIVGYITKATVRNCYCPTPSSAFLFNGSASGASRGSIYGWLVTSGTIRDVYWLSGFKAGNSSASGTFTKFEQSLSNAQMQNSGSVVRPSTSVSYSNLVAALNADASDWNAVIGQEIFASSWVMHSNGYPVPLGTAAAPDGGNSVPSSGLSLLGLCNRKIDEYGGNSVAANHIFLVAHRSNTRWSKQNNFPENSIPAIQKAIDLGVDMVELDVRETSDGHLVIMHDDKTGNTTNGGNNLVTNMTLAQIKALRMHARGSSTYPTVNGDYIRVPTLEEALEVCKGKILVNLDIKKNANEVEPDRNKVINAIRTTGTRDQVMIFGTGSKWWYAHNGFTQLDGPLAIHPYISAVSDINYYFEHDFFGCAKLFQYGYSIYYNQTISGFGKQCHAAGVLTYSNSLNYDSQILSWYNGGSNPNQNCTVLERFILSGSDFLQTDYYEIADQYFRNNGLR